MGNCCFKAQTRYQPPDLPKYTEILGTQVEPFQSTADIKRSTSDLTSRVQVSPWPTMPGNEQEAVILARPARHVVECTLNGRVEAARTELPEKFKSERGLAHWLVHPTVNVVTDPSASNLASQYSLKLKDTRTTSLNFAAAASGDVGESLKGRLIFSLKKNKTAGEVLFHLSVSEPIMGFGLDWRHPEVRKQWNFNNIFVSEYWIGVRMEVAMHLVLAASNTSVSGNAGASITPISQSGNLKVKVAMASGPEESALAAKNKMSANFVLSLGGGEMTLTKVCEKVDTYLKEMRGDSSYWEIIAVNVENARKPIRQLAIEKAKRAKGMFVTEDIRKDSSAAPAVPSFLFLGRSGIGKSTLCAFFLNKLSVTDGAYGLELHSTHYSVGHGADSHTMEMSHFEGTFNDRSPSELPEWNIEIVDSPGLDDSSSDAKKMVNQDQKHLATINNYLRGGKQIRAVVLVLGSEIRLPGSFREMLKNFIDNFGRDFFKNLVFVVNSWIDDEANADGARRRYKDELQQVVTQVVSEFYSQEEDSQVASEAVQNRTLFFPKIRINPKTKQVDSSPLLAPSGAMETFRVTAETLTDFRFQPAKEGLDTLIQSLQELDGQSRSPEAIAKTAAAVKSLESAAVRDERVALATKWAETAIMANWLLDCNDKDELDAAMGKGCTEGGVKLAALPPDMKLVVHSELRQKIQKESLNHKAMNTLNFFSNCAEKYRRGDDSDVKTAASKASEDLFLELPDSSDFPPLYDLCAEAVTAWCINPDQLDAAFNKFARSFEWEGERKQRGQEMIDALKKQHKDLDEEFSFLDKCLKESQLTKKCAPLRKLCCRKSTSDEKSFCQLIYKMDDKAVTQAVTTGERSRVVEFAEAQPWFKGWECPWFDGASPPAGCNWMGKEADIPQHKQECPRRPVDCPYCGKQICFNALEDHKRTCDCRPVDCPNVNEGCKETPRFKDVNSHDRVCQFKRLDCRNGCDASFLRRDEERHLKQECPLRPVDCPYCGNKFCFNALEDHKRTCDCRPVDCPNVNEGCKETPRFKDVNSHDRVCQFKRLDCRNGCDASFLRRDGERHYDTCPMQIVNCRDCSKRLQRKEERNHLRHECPKREVRCRLCKDTMTADSLEAHEARRCPKRTISCSGCQKTMTADALQAHEDHHCPKREVSCTLCSKSMRADTLSDHKANSCPKRSVRCNTCHDNMQACKLGSHLCSRNQPLPCRAGRSDGRCEEGKLKVCPHCKVVFCSFHSVGRSPVNAALSVDGHACNFL
eukprot:TRINITY_DN310_c0_g1_i2.p1 TRINITY_DN310_c0_g1~~TRINITY_DN310_c0_g1_i2.p1  ORF type:complete len:1261 (+),score=225.38 TRINITY_DN310_c0_g1_i2:74-3856(+)